MKKRFGAIALVAAMLFAMLAMPAAAVSVKSFTDVEEGDWFYKYVDYVAKKGFFLGTSETTYEPETAMTRAMFVTVLARVEKAKVDDSKSAFSDVPENEWYTGSVAWAAKNKIVLGYEDGTFRPDQSITREEMCALMDRYVEFHSKKNGVTHKLVKKPATFSDIDTASGYAKGYITTCAKRGLVEGCGDGTFRPLKTATRAEVAAVIYRLDWYVNGGGVIGGDEPVIETKTEKETTEVSIVKEPVKAYVDSVKTSLEDAKVAAVEELAGKYGLTATAEVELDEENKTVTVKGSAELDADLIDKLIGTVVHAAYVALGMDEEAEAVENAFTYEDVEADVKAAAEELGVDLSPEKVTEITKAVKALIKAEAREHAKTAWHEFVDASEEGKVCKTITVEGKEATVEINVNEANHPEIDGGYKAAAKTLIKDLAKQAKASLKNITEETDHITYEDWDVQLTVTLKDALETTTKTYEVTYTDGIETDRKLVSEETKTEDAVYTVKFQADLNGNGQVYYVYNTLSIHVPAADVDEVLTAVKDMMEEKATSAIAKADSYVDGSIGRAALKGIVEDIEDGGSTFEDLNAFIKDNVGVDVVAEVKDVADIDISDDQEMRDAVLALAVDYLTEKAKEADPEWKGEVTNFAEEYFQNLSLGSLGKVLESDFVAGKIGDKYDAQVKRATDYLVFVPDKAAISLNGVKITEKGDGVNLVALRDAETAKEAVQAVAALMKEPGLAELKVDDFTGDGTKITFSWNDMSASVTLVLVKE